MNGGLDGSEPVVCSRQVVVKPDMSLKDALKQVTSNTLVYYTQTVIKFKIFRF